MGGGGAILILVMLVVAPTWDNVCVPAALVTEI